MELNAPKTISYSGEVLSVSDAISKEYTNANGEKKVSKFLMITLSGDIQKPINESFYNSRKKDLSKGNYITLTFEQRVKDVTEYVDGNGEVQKHGSTSEGVTKCVISENPADRKWSMEDKIALIVNADAADKSALAMLLSGR